jgi:hypothetical protein
LRRPSLRPQLNQIRLWLRQGRTEAWIAHKLDISVGQLEQFKREQGLDGDPVSVAAPVLVEPPRGQLEVDDLEELDEEDEDEEEEREEEEEEDEQPEVPAARDRDDHEADEEGPPAARRRRRGRRGGRRRKRPATSFEGTFDHGSEGYGLWLDPAVADSDVYAEHWAGHREVKVTVEADAITIRRAADPEE